MGKQIKTRISGLSLYFAEEDVELILELNWNLRALDFYQRLGARPLNEWSVYRLTGKALQDLAQQP